MADFSIKNLLGFKIGKNKEIDSNLQSFTPPTDDDGAISISVTTPGIYGTYLDQEGVAKNESELIIRYREMASQPEIESAIDDIVNEAIVQDSDGRVINIILDKLEESDKVKKAIENEFKNIIKLLNFSNIAHDIFRRFYIDGRLYYHVIIDKKRPELGIQELRYIDPRKIKKIREIKKSKDSKTGVDVVVGINEYYVYNDLNTAVGAATNNFGPIGTIISPDSIINVNSGLMDAKRTMILSYLHKCIEGNQKVKTKDGWKFVKDIIPGDLIYAYNIDKDIFEETKVKNQWKTGNKKVIKIYSKHTSLICTPDHPILIKDENNEIKYVNAENIIINKHKIKSENDKLWENIIKIETLKNTADVYEIEVENEYHNFVVNGMVVKNCIKPFNQLRMIEDACVIWKVSRAAQRRLYYIDVGNLPKAKAEQVIKDYQVRFRNKVVYNAESGQIQNDRRFVSMLEDFFIPRRNDSKTTEITTLNDTSSFDDMSMVEYFEEKLYKSLSVPISRLNTEVKFSLGRSSEITRDELKFSKFVQRLRNRFSDIFDQALRIQCILKGICTDEEWESFKDFIIYDYVKDNYFEELKESEVLQDRLATLSTIDLYVGKYISEYWVRKNILKMTDEEIKIEDEIIRKEKQKNIINSAQDNLLQINVNNELGLNQTSEEENSETQTV